MLEIPQLLRKVNVVAVGVIKTLDFVPQGVDLFFAELADLGYLVARIYAFTVDKNGLQQFFGGKIGDSLLFPGIVLVEDGQRLGVIDRFMVEADEVGDGFAGFVIKEALKLFEVRVGDLFNIFADLDLGDDLTVFFFNRAKLVNAAENGGGAGGDESFANAEGIDLGALLNEVADDMLVKRVGNDDLTAVKTGFVHHFSDLAGKIGNVT